MYKLLDVKIVLMEGIYRVDDIMWKNFIVDNFLTAEETSLMAIIGCI